jgi:hypothetical protein
MIIDAAGERSEQGRFLSRSPGSSNAVFGAMLPTCVPTSIQGADDDEQSPALGSHHAGRVKPRRTENLRH